MLFLFINVIFEEEEKKGKYQLRLNKVKHLTFKSHSTIAKIPREREKSLCINK